MGARPRRWCQTTRGSCPLHFSHWEEKAICWVAQPRHCHPVLGLCWPLGGPGLQAGPRLRVSLGGQRPAAGRQLSSVLLRLGSGSQMPRSRPNPTSVLRPPKPTLSTATHTLLSAPGQGQTLPTNPGTLLPGLSQLRRCQPVRAGVTESPLATLSLWGSRDAVLTQGPASEPPVVCGRPWGWG